MKQNLTQAFVNRIKCSKNKNKEEFWDDEFIGFMLEVRATGTKNYYVRVKGVDGKRRSIKVADALTLDLKSAKAKALKLKKDREEQKETIFTNNTKDKNTDTDSTTISLGAFYEQYYLPYVKKHIKSYDTNASIFKNHILPKFKNIPMDEIKKKDIMHPNSKIKFWECRVYGRSDNDYFRVIDSQSMDDFIEILNGYIHLAKTAPKENKGLYWESYFKTKNAFADVQYIFASTVHKLQGSTYDSAYIDLASIINNEQIPNDLKYRLAYVAITRARQEIKILL